MQLGREKPFQVRLAQEQALEADARASAAYGALLPRIDLDAQHIQFDKSVNKATGESWAPQFPARVTTAGIQVSQPIAGLLPLTLQARASWMLAESAKESADQARRDGAFLGAQFFLGAVRASQFFSIAQSSVALAEKQKNDADALFRAGKLSQADAMRFELSLADARAQLTQAGVARELAMIALNDGLRIHVTDAKLVVPNGSIFEEKKPTPPALEDVLRRALDRRPELRTARNQLEITKLTAWAARLDYAPSINAFARYERDFQAADLRGKPSDSATAPLLAAKDDVRDKLALGLQLKWQLWDWGSRWNKISETVAQQKKAEINNEQALSLLKTEVIKSYLDLKAAIDALETSKSSARLAQEVYKLTQARFANGQASSTDLITAERDQARARAGLVSARSEVDLAWFRLQRSQGEEPTL
jgi:outer membrane protein TolC